MFDDNYFMQRALQEAQRALEEDEVPIGAVIVSDNQIIARAHNMTERLHDVTAHAEMQAITAAADALGGKYLTDCTIYVTLEPCTMCAGAIGWAQMGRLVYGAPDTKRGYMLTAPQALHPKTKVTSGVLANECAQIVKDFFQKQR
ncbi:MAG: nucleoside deaminase [Bacteroidaceae bacterium]|nr:nucleoside deaminase [Bacteroidaceae bacterium]